MHLIWSLRWCYCEQAWGTKGGALSQSFAAQIAFSDVDWISHDAASMVSCCLSHAAFFLG